ncbi:MAG: MarR family transcriptional regulator [Streptosporangiaceae bacterium]|nr:MarR family transcriptional regulator [Streptosporangiaceae bacterium]MBV9857438.1 MarR family transcriptional regulator [Streptosporangiaceae bacterium]
MQTLDAKLDVTDPVAEVRAFNRFYTNVIGVLQGMYLGTPYSVTEARLLFELARQGEAAVASLRRSLDIDAGYLSRVLARFEDDGMVRRQRTPADARRQVISLTSAGRSAVRELDARAAKHISGLLAGVDRGRLLGAMRVITDVLSEVPRQRAIVLRPPGPGDMGWVVQRHGAVYAAEYGWDCTFEALVARIVADYIDNRKPEREAAWIAEVDGVPAGCVFCVADSDTVARLRLLLVEPAARGLGIGSRLVEEVLRFARRTGYGEITLWTNDVLASARRLYEAAGFTLAGEEPHHSFGHDLVGQTWTRAL